MTPDVIMRELARDDMFPRAAMAAARADRESMVPIFVDLISRLAAQTRPEIQKGDVAALIPVFHMLGEFREPQAYRPLLQLMRQPTETIDYLLGDAITETSFRVIAGTFDGDLQPLFDAIEDSKADEFARNSMMNALVLITQLHPEQRSAIEEYFRSFRRRCPEERSDVLIGWADGVADLGLEDMADDIRAVFEAGLIPEEYCDADHILADLKASVEAGGVPVNTRYQRSLITDSITELSKWYGYSDAYFAQQKKQKTIETLGMTPLGETFMHEAAPVGRNDPCPCGSGKKFKKCCLN